jgi:rhodanese-related sulfurtransferase
MVSSKEHDNQMASTLWAQDHTHHPLYSHAMGKKHSPQFLKLTSEARAVICEIHTDTLKDRLHSEKPLLVIDVREQHEWDAGHLPRAIHLSKGVIERDIEAAVPDFDAEIVCYCGGGYRSALVTTNLERMGYTQVWSLEGGYHAWSEAGHPVTDD